MMGKMPLGPWRCDDDIEINIKEIGWEFVDWICLVHNGGQ
jgi:hypothetical protein